jgi:hypothetical protein
MSQVRTELITRFWDKVDKTDGCWLWKEHVSPTGYCNFRVGKTKEYSHRFAWEISNNAKIPKDMTVDHLCKIRHCVNPNHLEIVSRGENALRGDGPCAKNLRKKLCKRGHELTSYVRDDNKKYRACRVCCKLKMRRLREEWRSLA